MGSPIAIIAVVSVVLFTAPLVLGAYVVAQGQNRTFLMAWFGLLTALFALSLLIGVIALVLLLLAG
ncbi:MAG TPA: hypothetical protein VGM69_07885 [Chloroflexota bacterium]|jgi:hypothetical protein